MNILLPNNNQNKHGKRSTAKFLTAFSLLCFSALFSAPSYSHRGAANEVDECRIGVGSEVIHISAYTPTFTEGKGYCRYIPNVGLTNLVFDYEGKKLRDLSIEFEVTKEPEGTRIFYLEPQKAKSGSVKADIDFSKYGAGNYLAHVTIVHDGEKQDSHLPFVVGAEENKSPWRRYLIFAGSVAVLMAIGIPLAIRKFGDPNNPSA